VSGTVRSSRDPGNAGRAPRRGPTALARERRARLRTRELTARTWPQFERFFQKHNGVWGNCWCLSFHRRPGERFRGDPHNRIVKREAVRAGRSHGIVVLAGDVAVGSCQFGRAAELPRIDGMRSYSARAPPVRDRLWRITCFFVDRDHRRRGVAAVALRGALDAIRAHGGGVVEAYPLDTGGKRVSGSFLWWGPRSFFERAGFHRVTPLGKNQWLVRRAVRPRTGVRRNLTAGTS